MVRHSRDSGNPRVVGVNVGYPSRPPDSERYRLLPLAKLIEHVYYYIHMTHRSPCHSDQIHKATEATRCLMPENQKKTPRSKLTKRNPDSKLNSDTTPASDGQIQQPEMADNGRQWPGNRNFQTQLGHYTRLRRLDTTARNDRKWPGNRNFRTHLPPAGRPPQDSPRQVIRALGRLWHRATPYGSLRSVGGFTFQVQHLIPYGLGWSVVAEAFARSIVVGLYE